MHILTPRRELILPFRFGMAGFYRLKAIRPNGEVRIDTGWFPNIITAWGLNAKGDTNDLNRNCHVGSGNTAPSVNDTTLETWVASTNLIQDSSSGAQANTPYFGWHRRTYRFPEGAAAGNLAEIGIGPLGGANDNLFSRALILDSTGTPTAITILSDEILDTTYEARLYPPTTDGAFTVSDGTTSYDIITRASNVTDGGTWGGFDIVGKSAAWRTFSSSARSGDIGTITEAPSGTGDGASSQSNLAYSNNSLEKELTITWGLNRGNVGGVRSLFAGSLSGRIGAYQAQFTPVIDKDDTKELTINIKVGWDRAAI